MGLGWGGGYPGLVLDGGGVGVPCPGPGWARGRWWDRDRVGGTCPGRGKPPSHLSNRHTPVKTTSPRTTYASGNQICLCHVEMFLETENYLQFVH